MYSSLVTSMYDVKNLIPASWLTQHLSELEAIVTFWRDLLEAKRALRTIAREKE